MFKEFGEKDTVKWRYCLRNDKEAEPYEQRSGKFTPWKVTLIDY
jgi:phosphoribulokinase